MIVRKPTYLKAAVVVLIVVLAMLGVSHHKGEINTVPVLPTIACSKTSIFSTGIPAHAIVNEYGWYTDGPSNILLNYDAREH